ncbi:DNA primase [Eubacterium oxidoreducens]|uniref:DNA primase n=1 Tax=Eubacterium oxidoreducens TaxID=1732 RepID=A0A1G6BLS5_EUBOX|nr:DNA primase [Eubacterium oxidoreducens]SDB21527.1 DNA primase [Eubacterium oxidoreducens]
MAYYSDELVEQVRMSNDIVDVISGYVSLKKKGANHMGLCPFHNEKSPSFSVSGSKQLYHCFGCGASGNVFSFLMEYEKYTFPEAVEALAERAGISLPKVERSKEEREKEDTRTKLYEINKEAAKYFYMLLRAEPGKKALEYLNGRELTEETMTKFGLGYSAQYSNDLYQYLRKKGYSDSLLAKAGLITLDERQGGYDKFWNRVMFPIMDQRGKVIAFGGRVMGDGKPKYLNSPETMIFDKSRNLYGLNFARASKREGIILCEGYMDVIALHQAGFDNAVASLGTAFTPGHANLVKRFAKTAYLSFDSDEAGIKAALRTIPIMTQTGVHCKIIHMDPYKDPDEFIKALGKEEYEKRIEQAENSFLFEVRMKQREYNMSDPAEKNDFYRQAASMLLRFTQEIERDSYIHAVATHYQLTDKALKELVREQAAKGAGIKMQAPLKTGAQSKKKTDGLKEAQKLLLTWMIEEESLFDVLKPYLGPQDFTEELYRQVARMLYEQKAQGHVHPADIMSHFQSEDEQRQIGELFHTELTAAKTKQARQQALKELLITIKKGNIEKMSSGAQSADMNHLMEMIKKEKELEELKKITISL